MFPWLAPGVMLPGKLTLKKEPESMSSARHTVPGAACQARMGPHQRLFLMELVHAFEGSTALQSVLMSSPHLSTLCSYNSWQCEGQWILEDAVSNKTNGIVGQNWRTRNLLPTFSEVWDLDREVLFDKSPHFLLDNVESIHKHLVAALPDKMLQAGIRRLDAAYIMMWRPTCLGFLAGHSEKWSTKQFAMRMLAVLRQLVEVHKLVRTMGLPILVICQGDLLWDAGATLRRIESFLPCLHSVTNDFVPTLGKDVFPGNQWKVDGSLKTYSESIKPESIGYDVRSRNCSGDMAFSSILGPRELSQSEEAIEYLKFFS